MPIAINENPDGSDNPEGRALNRRTDFQIIGKLSVDDLEVEEKEKDTKTKSKPPKKKGNTFWCTASRVFSLLIGEVGKFVETDDCPSENKITTVLFQG